MKARTNFALVACLVGTGCSSAGSAQGPAGGADAATPDAGESSVDAQPGVATEGGADGSAGIFAPAQPFASNETLVQFVSPLRTGAGNSPITLKFDLVSPSQQGQAKWVVILLVGGNGYLGLTPNGFATAGNNFVARTRQVYAQHGLVAVLPDVPSDHDDPSTGLDSFRDKQAHADDMRAIIGWLRTNPTYGSAPVWVVGTSRGTISAANVAARAVPSSGGPDGMVLTSSIGTNPPPSGDTTDPENIQSIDGNGGNIEGIKVPIQMIHNDLDLCAASKLSAAKGLSMKWPQAVFSEVHGGTEACLAAGCSDADQCDALTYHGFYGPSATEPGLGGMDDEVVGMIIPFVQSH